MNKELFDYLNTYFLEYGTSAMNTTPIGYSVRILGFYLPLDYIIKTRILEELYGGEE